MDSGQFSRQIVNMFTAGAKVTSLVQTGCQAQTASYPVLTVGVNRDEAGTA
jgi:hypothetical protein